MPEFSDLFFLHDVWPNMKEFREHEQKPIKLLFYVPTLTSTEAWIVWLNKTDSMAVNNGFVVFTVPDAQTIQGLQVDHHSLY